MKSLGECKRELNSIISELQDIEWGIRRDFEGIGEDMCANCVGKIADKYTSVKRRLDRVDQNRLAEWLMGEE